jgi:hypothetical protein
MTEPNTRPDGSSQDTPHPADMRTWAATNEVLRHAPVRFKVPGPVAPGRRFAFYGRTASCDTEEAAMVWEAQVRRAQTALTRHRGQIVAEYFDIATPASTRWSRRAQASALLDALAYPDREFDAVVLGEGCRAFFAGPYEWVFPYFAHHQVPLWIPETDRPTHTRRPVHQMVVQLLTDTAPPPSADPGDGGDRKPGNQP